MRPEFFHPLIDGLGIAQNKWIESAFNKLLSKYGQPEHIIEIGTCRGGFAVFLKRKFPKSTVVTFDKYEWGDLEYIKHRNNIYKQEGIIYINEDCFLHEGFKIRSLLTKKSILLCDGAHKGNEFTFFTPYIQCDSIIMAHDYGRNEEYFRSKIEGKYWTGSFEFDGSKYDKWSEDHNLKPYLQSDFDKAVWYIRKKIC